jgi:HD-GYP domain-containing protein (c-di-GMP phosphodiesterase class II)
MTSENGVLTSKLAWRNLLLFVVCALAPISVFAVFSLHSLTTQLQEQGAKRLSQTSRAEGTVIYERLSFLEGDLRVIGLASHAGTGADPESAFASLYGHSPEFAKRFSGVALVTPDGTQRLLFGKAPSRPAFSADEQKYLDSGRTVLSAAACNERTDCVLLSRDLDSNRPADGALIAQANPTYLWSAEEIPSKAEICVLDPAGKVLFGTTNTPSAFPGELSRSISGEFNWTKGPRDFQASFWSLPLANAFFAPHWTIVVSEAKADIFAPLSRFKITFYLVGLAAIWIALLFSLVQARQILSALNEFKSGTRRIADGQFPAHVSVKRSDEFGQLATSFNFMADQVEKQANSLHSAAKTASDAKELQWGTLTAFSRAIDSKSQWTAGHSERVATWAMKIARAMSLPLKEQDTIRRGGLLHDIGNLGIAVSVLDKPGKFTAEELKVLDKQVNAGGRILGTIPALADCLPIVMQHHEWLDGSGYPGTMKGEDISLQARIVAVADCFDALTSARPDRAALQPESAVQFLQEGSGKQFDPKVLEALQQALKQDVKDREKEKEKQLAKEKEEAKQEQDEEVEGDTDPEVAVP